jgi:F0F1-type ATP synthase membrane subunit b/b'
MKLKSAVDDAKGKVGDMSNKAQSAVDDAKKTLDDAKSKVSQVQTKAQSAVNDAKAKGQSAMDDAKAKGQSAVDDVKSKGQSAMDDAKAKVGAIEDDAKSTMSKAGRVSKVSKRIAKSRVQKMRRNRLERNGRTRKTLDDTKEGDVELPDKSTDVKAPEDFGKQRSSWGETKGSDDMLPDDAESLNRGGARGKMMSMDDVDAEIQKRSSASSAQESKTEDANLQETKTQDPTQPKSTEKNPDAEDDLEGDLEDVGENAAEDVGEDTAGGFLEGLGAAASATGIGAVVGIPLALGGAILEGAGLYESAKSAVDWFERDILGEQPKIALNKLPTAPITALQSGQMITPNSDTMDTQPSYSGGW